MFSSKILHVTAVAAMAALGISIAAASPATLRISAKEYRDHMFGGWLGQMVGVSWGAPTEFSVSGQMLPDERVPAWHDGMANEAFGQDDLYVEMTFVRTLEKYGLGVSQRQAGIDFANSGYGLCHANNAGREALRAGIAPPDSGHPKFNPHADDIDFQIEADFTGLLSPGMPNAAIKLGEKFGELMNYGDGLYGGQFMGAMYSEAFFTKDPEKLVRAGLAAIPAKSQYAECIRDVLAWHAHSPNDWRSAWQKIEAKYDRNLAYRRGSCEKGVFNIDAKINGAYVAMGLLYGEGDPDRTTIVAMQCGQDSDCDPSNALGVLGAAIGYQGLPEKYRRGLDMETKFYSTDYNVPKLLAACDKIVREVVVEQGGRVEKDANGEEWFVIPVRKPRPSAFVQCWAPGPVANSRFTATEKAELRIAPRWIEAMKVLPGWKVENCGEQMSVGLIGDYAGKHNVVATHPFDPIIPCVVKRTLTLPKGKTSTLELTVGNHAKSDWKLVVKANGKTLLEKLIGRKDVDAPVWEDVSVDLSAYAGKKVRLELVNASNDWSFEAAYWSKIEVVSR